MCHFCQYSRTVLSNKFAVSRTCFFTGQMREGNSVKKFLNAAFSECFSFGGVGWLAVLLFCYWLVGLLFFPEVIFKCFLHICFGQQFFHKQCLKILEKLK